MPTSKPNQTHRQPTMPAKLSKTKIILTTTGATAILTLAVAVSGPLGSLYAGRLSDLPPLGQVANSPRYQACLEEIGSQVNLNYARLTVKTFCYREAIQQQPRPRDLEQLHIYYTGSDKQAFGDRLLHGKPANHPE